MWPWLKSNRTGILLGVLSSAFYLSFAYDLDRADFAKLITLFGGLFVICYQLIKQFGWNFWLLMGLGVLFRLLLLPAIPNLSQDFYRFLWDGRLLLGGHNPYLFTPTQWMDMGPLPVAQGSNLIEGMGALNAGHYSNYPPVNQLNFALAALFGGSSILGSVIVLRLQIILADIGILFVGKRFLEELGLPASRIFWFFLNPFIILEATGNLHFETMMLFFLLAGIYLLYKKQWLAAAFLWGMSISVKLIPLMFLPLLLPLFLNGKRDLKGIWRAGRFWMACLLAVVLSFIPFYSQTFLGNFSETIGLWFQNFEFNASVHYVIRWISYQTVGWNQIQTTGPVLSLIVILFIFSLSLIQKNRDMPRLFIVMLWSVFVYLLLATTVHPWYVATPLLLCLFTPYRFPIIWSVGVMLSYSAYGPEGFEENYWLIGLEYLVVIGWAYWELRNISLQKAPKAS